MAVFNPQPTNPTASPLETINPKVKDIAHRDYRTTVTDSRYVEGMGLKTHIEGFSWIVDYYSKSFDTNDQLHGIDGQTDVVSDQRRLIKNLELRVSDPLTDSESPDTGKFIVSGTSSVYPSVRPNEGDSFLGDIGDGTTGVFEVTEVKRLTIYRESAYEISYVLKAHRDTLKDYVAGLNARVIETLTFVRDRIRYGRPYLIQEQSLASLHDLNQLRSSLINEFMVEFFDESERLLIHSMQSPYDPMLPVFFLKLVDSRDHPWVGKINQPISDVDFFISHPTVLDCIISPETTQRVFNDSIKPVNARIQARSFNLRSLVYYGIFEILQPDGVRSVLEEPDVIVDDNQQNPSEAIVDPPKAYPVDLTKSYLFSPNFYADSDDAQLSLIEIFVKKLLNNETYETGLLLSCYMFVKTMSPLDRFYYYPVLLALTLHAIRNN